MGDSLLVGDYITGDWTRKSIWNMISSMDHLLLWYYMGGLGLGLVVLLVLSYFPGRRQDFQKKFDPSNSVLDPTKKDMVSPSKCSSSSITPTGSTTTNTDTTAPATSNGFGLSRRFPGRKAATAQYPEHNNDKHNTTTTPQSDAAASGTWAGDHIAPNVLERMRQTLHLTEEQMKLVLDTSRRQAIHNKNHPSGSYASEDEGWTPHQVLNRMVYVILMALLIYIANRDYGNVVTVWFISCFPREAATLGITLSWAASSSSS